MQRFGAEPHECIVFEDSRSGIQAGVAAGARLIIGIQSSLSDHILRRHGAHATVKDFLDFTPHFLLQASHCRLRVAYDGRLKCAIVQGLWELRERALQRPGMFADDRGRVPGVHALFRREELMHWLGTDTWR